MRFPRMLMSATIGIVALIGAACGGAGPLSDGEDTQIEVQAVFDDVIDLVTDHSVRSGDVTIGRVTAIELTEDQRALVTMVVDNEVGLPVNIEATLSKTGLLGERFVDLRAPAFGGAGTLADGQLITNTRIITDFEDLTQVGGDVLAFVSADRLGAAIETGAVAFGGRQALIGRFVDDVNSFVGTYNDNADVLLALIDSLDAFAAAYETNAEVNAAVLADLQVASEALQETDDKLLDTLEEVTRLSLVGGDFLETNQAELASNLDRLRNLLNALTAEETALERLLEWFPRHNNAVPAGSIDNRAQVWLDFIVCGLNETEGDISRDCTAPNPGQPGLEFAPPFHPFSEECFDDFTLCEGSPQSGGDGVNDGFQGGEGR